MNISKRKKRTLRSLLAWLITSTAKAWIGIVIGLLVILVGAYMIYKLLEVIKKVLPPDPPPPNNVVTNNITYLWLVTNVVSPSLVSSQALKVMEPAKYKSEAIPAGVTLQYGIYSTDTGDVTQPWVMLGARFEETVDGTEYEGENSADRYVVYVSGGGTSWKFVYTAVDDHLETITYQPQTVVIERTTNMVDWVGVYTNNAYGIDTVRSFIDTNPPPSAAFYRLGHHGESSPLEEK